MIFTSFQGARFYPNIFGKSRFGVNETRRVTLSASILEGLGLVTRHDDPLGGVTWSGRDLFEMFDKSQCKLHALKRAFIALEPLENISQEDISFAMEAADKFNLASTEAPIISTDGLSSEQQRTVHNQNIFCKCGFIKKMEIEDAKKGKSVKRSVHVGTKRRTRCKECPGCKAKMQRVPTLPQAAKQEAVRLESLPLPEGAEVSLLCLKSRPAKKQQN